MTDDTRRRTILRAGPLRMPAVRAAGRTVDLSYQRSSPPLTVRKVNGLLPDDILRDVGPLPKPAMPNRNGSTSDIHPDNPAANR